MRFYVGLVAVTALLLLPNISSAAVLFSDDFDVDHTANWTVNFSGIVDSDEEANFFFDYGAVGIPQAPNSAGPDRRGLTLQANRDSNFDGLSVFSGFSVSPTGQDFASTGNYKLTFDWWANSVGPFPAGGSGSTQLSTFGVGTNGTVPQWPGGTQNSVYFGGIGDGNTAADWRVYSPSLAGRFSYQEGTDVSDPPNGTFVYAAKDAFPESTIGVRSSNHPYYAGFGSKTPPAEQTALYPNQTGTTVVGSAGFQWHEVEITNIDGIIKWKLNDLLMATVDTIAEGITLSGGNIFFGQSDINAGASNDANRFNLLYSLIDNVEVSTIEAVTNTPDFNRNGTVDAADYTLWRNNVGLMGSGTQDTGDANGDTNVDMMDYELWKTAFGTMPGSGASIGAGGVPEPTALALVVSGILGLALEKRRR